MLIWKTGTNSQGVMEVWKPGNDQGDWVLDWSFSLKFDGAPLPSFEELT